MNLFVRMSGDIPPFQKSFFRNLVAVVFAAVVLVKQKSGFRWNKGNLKYLLLRSGIGTIGIVCNFYALSHIPLSDASILNKMSPFFAIVFSIFILKEKIKPVQFLIVLGALAGAICVIKPSFSNVLTLPAFIALCGGMMAGLAYTLVRDLGKKGVKGVFIVFFFSGFSCLSSGQFSITAAYCHAPAKDVSVYDYSQIIFAAGLGFIVFGQIPDLLSWVGYVIIVSMALLMFIYNKKKSKSEKTNDKRNTV